MRFVVVGAGAIGGVVGGRLLESGHDVVFVARGAHLEATARDGLRLEASDRVVTLPVPVVGRAAEAGLTADDVVLVAVKSQDTAAVLEDVRAAAPDDVHVVCLQNGVANERTALRLFRNVHAVPVMCPAVHLRPGVVQAYSSPVSGILDVGRYPSGVDDTDEAVAAAFRASTFESVARPDVMRWKWSKLLMNLGNAIEALCGPVGRAGELAERARAEGEAALAAAGIAAASAEEDRERRGDLLQMRPIGEERRPGGSTWQSLARGAGVVETDWLNGEIVLLGRLHGVPTPVNELLQRLMRAAAAEGAPPASMTPDDVLALLE